MMYKTAYSKIGSNDFGICHADELFIQFRPKMLGDINEEKRSEKDIEVTNKMTQMWTQFAYGKQPHPDWKPLSKEYHQWARIDQRPLVMEWKEDFEHKIEFVQSMFDILDR